MDKALSKKERKKLKLQEKQKQKQQQSKQKLKKPQNQQKHPQKTQNNNHQQKSKPSSQTTKPKPSKQQSSPQQNQPKKKHSKDTKKTQKHIQKQEEEEEQQNLNQEQQLDFNNVLQGQQNMQFSFLVAEINEKHYHSMKTILEKFARLTGVISSDWADAIVGNGKAGNVVIAQQAESQQEEQQEQEQQQQEQEQEQEQEDDQQNVCSGVINILPSTHKLTKKVLTKISQSVQSQKIQGIAKASQISQFLCSNSCSLLICQRAVNLPAFIVKSMHEVLSGDLETLKSENSKQYVNICGKYILGISEVQIQRQHKNKGSAENVDIQSLIFSRFEDYLFAQNSEGWWVGQASPNAVRKVPLHRFYFLMRTQKYFETVGQIGSLLEQS